MAINWEEKSFSIISKSAGAKGFLLQALNYAKEGKYDLANETINKANEQLAAAGQEHMDVISEEANNVQHPFKVLFMHSEDQFLTTQLLSTVVQEFIEVYKRMGEHKCQK